MPTLKMSKTLTATLLILPKTRTSCQRIAMAGSQQIVFVGTGVGAPAMSETVMNFS